MANPPLFEVPHLPERPSTILVGPEADALYDAVSSVFDAMPTEQKLEQVTEYFSTIEGDRIELICHPTRISEVDEAKASVGGLFRRVTSKFRRSESSLSFKGVDDPYSYVAVLKPFDSKEEVVVTLWGSRAFRGIAAMAQEYTEAFDGSKSSEPLHNEEIASSATIIADRLMASERFSAEVIMEANQLLDCSLVGGHEAAETYSFLKPVVDELLRNDKSAPQVRDAHVARPLLICDGSDGLPISIISVTRPQFGPDTIQVLFSESPLLRNQFGVSPDHVFVVEVIASDQRAAVMYNRVLKNSGTEDAPPQTDPIALDPEMRRRIDRAIVRQVTPNNFRDAE
ncbi:MAG: hypothetical protein ABWX94_02115 [Candidatus Saccharimonadales bacterium]